MEMGSPVNKERLEGLVESIFQNNATVYEAYSVPDNELRVFQTSSEVMRYIDEVSNKKENLAYLSIHYPEAGGYINIKRINLIPEKCKGAKVRYSAEGWGLIQFKLWFNENSITCEIDVNSEKRALKWASTYPDLKSPDLWEWKEVQRQCQRLKRVLKKSA